MKERQKKNKGAILDGMKRNKVKWVKRQWVKSSIIEAQKVEKGEIVDSRRKKKLSETNKNTNRQLRKERRKRKKFSLARQQSIFQEHF